MHLSTHPLLRSVIRLFNDQSGQDGLEYLVATGAVAVALAAALIAGFALLLPEIAGLTCPSVDTAASPAAIAGSCLGP